MAGVGSSLSFPKKSADSQTGPTTSKVVFSAFDGAGETNSICCTQKLDVTSKHSHKHKLTQGIAKMTLCHPGSFFRTC